MVFNIRQRALMKVLGLEVEGKESRQYVLDLDLLTLVSVKGVISMVEANNAKPYLESEVRTSDIDLAWKKVGDKTFTEWERVEISENKHRVSDSFTTTILGEDEFYGKYSCQDAVIGKGMRSTVLFPMRDPTFFHKTREEGKQMLEDAGLGQGQANPESYAEQPYDMVSDESFSRMFFYGICAPLISVQEEVPARYDSLSKDLGPFVVDMPLQDQKVRRGFSPLGVCIHFSEDQQVTAIYDYHKKALLFPGDEGWEQVKFLAKVTGFTLLTAREHLTWSHLIMSNSLTRNKTLFLSPSHPIRRLLTIFTFRSTEVNSAAFDSLVPETSLLHRATGFTYPSMENIFEMSYTGSNIFEPFGDRKVHPTIQKMTDEGNFPYVSQGQEYFEIVRTFVRNWLAKAGSQSSDEQAIEFYNAMKKTSVGQKYEVPDHSDENMINLISQAIFTVTAYHELIGNVTDYVASYPDRAGFRVVEGKTQVDVQSHVIASCIGASTSVRMPMLMRPFKNFFGEGGAPKWEREMWNSFLVDLRKQSNVVQAADSERKVSFRFFDPARFECSISV